MVLDLDIREKGYRLIKRFSHRYTSWLREDLIQAGHVALLTMEAHGSTSYGNVRNAMRNCYRKNVCAVDLPRNRKLYWEACNSFDKLIEGDDDETGYSLYGVNDLNFGKRDTKMMLEKLFGAIEALTPRQRELISLRFEEPEHTQGEVSQKWGISRARVYQLEMKVLAILREALEDNKEAL